MKMGCICCSRRPTKKGTTSSIKIVSSIELTPFFFFCDDFLALLNPRGYFFFSKGRTLPSDSDFIMPQRYSCCFHSFNPTSTLYKCVAIGVTHSYRFASIKPRRVGLQLVLLLTVDIHSC